MHAYQVQSDGGIDALARIKLPAPEEPGRGQVLVRLAAASLNYRDLGIVRGGYARNDTCPVIPLSDGAGVVEAVGTGVTQFAVGDRVTGCFVQDWVSGPPTDAALKTSLGGGIDGVLRERMLFPEHGLVRSPEHLSDEEAACLPCAALTAWHALFATGNLRPGQTVLLLGTGGVSIFALQLAKAAGARVIVTSSSDQKLRHAKRLKADEIINYRDVEDWPARVHELTGGRGVDNVVEVGGPGTLAKSLQCVAVGGQVSLIGVLSDPSAGVNPLPAMFNVARIQGIYVGSRAMFEDMNAAVTHHNIRPEIDRVFDFDHAQDAYRHLKGATHLGKVVIRIGA